jgi:7-keto-8-aminopelargonate synthetase-like enzyme
MEDLDRVLANHKDSPVLVVTDGVFSMGGDICKLPQMVELKKKYGCRLMVDEAHTLGVLGPKGDGTGPHFGVQKDVDMVMGTFSKSLVPSAVSWPRPTRSSTICATTAGPHLLGQPLPRRHGGGLKSLEIIQREPERRERLWKIVHRMLKEYKAMGWDTLNSESAIIPLMVRDNMKTFAMTRELGEMGIFVTPVVAPAVASTKPHPHQLFGDPYRRAVGQGLGELPHRRQEVRRHPLIKTRMLDEG